MMLANVLLRIISIYHQHKKYFFTFSIAGIVTAIIYFSLFSLSQNLFHANHLMAVSIAYSIAAAFHFIFNRGITFKAKGHTNASQILKYMTLLVINYSITLIILEVSLQFTTVPYIGLLIAAGITAMTGYGISKLWVFKEIKSAVLQDFGR